jgi:hypothetical protein
MLEETAFQLKGENEKLNVESQEHKAQVADHETFIHEMESQIEIYKGEAKPQEQLIKNLQEENNKTKLNFENSMFNVNSETVTQVDKLKKVINESVKKISSL